MKLISITNNTNYKKPLFSISQFDTETKRKTYITIPEHIAKLIIDFEEEPIKIADRVYAYQLKSEPLDPNYQD